MEKSNKNKRTQTTAEVKVEVQEHSIVVHHGENVKHYRGMKGYSQEYMAAELKISQPKYSEIEKGALIKDEYLTKIAELLNLGIEWLTDIPIQKGTTSYHQDGNGNTNFQNTGDVNYNINNPVEEVVAAYKDTISTLKKTIESEIADKKQAVEAERKEKQTVLDRFVAYVESQKEK